MVAHKKEAVPAPTVETLVKLFNEAGISLFKERTGLPLNQAQRNLEGLTHYVDDKSIAAFKAKIHSVHVLDEGLVLGMVESVQAGPSAESGRVYRPVFFNVFGGTIYRPEIADSFDSIKKANHDFWTQSDEIDAVEANIEGLQARAKALADEADKLNDLVAQLQ